MVDGLNPQPVPEQRHEHFMPAVAPVPDGLKLDTRRKDTGRRIEAAGQVMNPRNEIQMPETEGIPAMRLKIAGELGSGAYGTTFLAWDLYSGDHVTIKAYSSDARVCPPHIRDCVQNSIAIHHNELADLPRGVMQQHVRGDMENEPIVFSFEEGPTAEEALGNVSRASISEAIAASRAVLIPLLKNLSQIHSRGVIHREVASRNVTVSGTLLDGDTIMREGEDDGLVLNNAWYRAPETQGGIGYSFQSDIYAAGVVAADFIIDEAVREVVMDEEKRMAEAEQSTRREQVVSRNTELRRALLNAVTRNGVGQTEAWQIIYDHYKDNAEHGPYIKAINKMMATQKEDRYQSTEECLDALAA